MYAPNWLLLYPGILFLILGVILGGILVFNQATFNSIKFSIYTLLYCACMISIGMSILQMYLIAKVYAYNHDFFPRCHTDWNEKIKEDIIIVVGGIIVLIGIVISIAAIGIWDSFGLGNLNEEQIIRMVIPAVLCLLVGVQSICTGFIIGVMKIKTESNI